MVEKLPKIFIDSRLLVFFFNSSHNIKLESWYFAWTQLKPMRIYYFSYDLL